MWRSFHPVYSSPKIYPIVARFNSTHTCSVSQKLSLSHICSAYTTLTYNRYVFVSTMMHTSSSRPYWQKFYFMITFLKISLCELWIHEYAYQHFVIWLLLSNKVCVNNWIKHEILVRLQARRKNSSDITITHYIFINIIHWSWRKHLQINQ
jgi:hypothetical protein